VEPLVGNALGVNERHSSEEERAEYRRTHGMSDATGNGKLVIDGRLLLSLVLALAGGGVAAGYRAAPVTAAIASQADHDDVTKLNMKMESLNASVIMLSNRLEKLEDKNDEINVLVKQIYYRIRRDYPEAPAPALNKGDSK
jgi:hypothetical protein